MVRNIHGPRSNRSADRSARATTRVMRRPARGRGASLCRNQCAVPPGLDFVPLSFPALTCGAFLCRRFAAGVVARSTLLTVLGVCDTDSGAPANS